MSRSILSDDLTFVPDENGADEAKYANNGKQGVHHLSYASLMADDQLDLKRG